MIQHLEEMRALPGCGSIRAGEPMKLHTSFRIGGPAAIWAEPKSPEGLAALIAFCKEKDLPFTVIGNGSNLLCADEGVEQVVICTRPGLEFVTVEGNRIVAGAGTLLGKVAGAALKAGLSGLEFASGIPGTVGGAVLMNAGAYNGEIAKVLTRAQILFPDGTLRWVENREFQFDYRFSKVSEWNGVVCAAEFLLTPADPAEIKAYMDDLAQRRRSKQPLEYPSAGSTFKRPKDFFAGKLIQDCGFAGYQVGGARVSEKHCGFVINAGDATAADVLKLCAEIRAKVKAEYGPELEMEVRTLGFADVDIPKE